MLLQSLFIDIRFVFRQLRKTPGFTLAGIVLLALGIGTNTAVFTLANSRILRSLPVGDAGVRALQEQYASRLHLQTWFGSIGLAIACVSASSLLMVGTTGRRMEISIRTALGATHKRILCQFFTESLLLAGMVSFASQAVAQAGERMLLVLAFPESDRALIDTMPSPVIIAFTFGGSLFSAMLFGVAPGWIAAQAGPTGVLRRCAGATTARAWLLQRWMTVLMTVLSLALLACAGVFPRSMTMIFSTSGLLVTTVGLCGISFHGMTRRTHEIGIRTALGAGRCRIIFLLLRGAMVQTLLGLAIGIPVVLLCALSAKAQLQEFSSEDARGMMGTIFIIAIATCAAGIIPTWRAANIEPMQALRTE